MGRGGSVKENTEFNTERDFDRALAGINKISNKAKKERSNFDYPKNLNQLKNGKRKIKRIHYLSILRSR
jgi:hypothetical protein